MHLDKNRKKKAPMYYSGALLDLINADIVKSAQYSCV